MKKITFIILIFAILALVAYFYTQKNQITQDSINHANDVEEIVVAPKDQGQTIDEIMNRN